MFIRLNCGVRVCRRKLVQISQNKQSSLQNKNPKSIEPIKTDIKKSHPIRVIIIIILTMVVLNWCLFGGWESLGVQKGMETYLEEKYNKDFVVELPHLEGTGIAITGSWRAKSHPVDSNSLIFEVGRVQDKERYFDDYDDIIWKNEEYPRIESFLKNLKPTLSSLKFNLVTNIPTAQEPDPIRGDVPNIDSAIQKYGDRFNYDLSVMFSVKSLKDDQTKTEVRSNFLKIVNYINSKGLKNPGLMFLVSSTNENSGYRCSTSDITSRITMEKMLDNCLGYPDKKGGY